MASRPHLSVVQSVAGYFDHTSPQSDELFRALYLVVPPCRGSTSSWYGPPDPLPGGCISISHHRDCLPDEAHLDDNDRRLQVCQDQEAHYLPQPQLHGPAAGV